MNDFLHSLRNGNKRFDKSSRQYNGHNNGQHKNSHNNGQHKNGHNNGQYEKTNGNARRHSMNPNKILLDQLPTMLNEIIPVIKNFLEENIIRQKQLVEVMEYKAMAEDRKAEAIQSIAVALANIAGQDSRNYQQDGSIIREDSKIVDFPFESRKDLKQVYAQDEELHNHILSKNMEGQVRLNSEQARPNEGVSHISREKIMDTIKALRNNGLSFKKVAQYLDDQGVPTFSGRGKWHAPTIANLLK